MNSALLLDRDGVILVQETGSYITNVAEARFEVGALDALVRLSKDFDKIIIVTNQAGINKGLYRQSDVVRIHDWIANAVFRRGGHIDGFYICPHRPDEMCACRKPNNGMFLKAIQDHDIDIVRSRVVGDTIRDLEAGKSLGLKPVLVLTGEGSNTHSAILGTHKMNGVTVYNDLYSFAFGLQA